MTDPNRQHLCLVAGGDPCMQPTPDNDDMAELWLDTGSADPLLDDPRATESSANTRMKTGRLPRSKAEFAIVPLSWLSDRQWDPIFPARTRLYLYLQYKTRRGERPWTLTTAELAELGFFYRQNKLRSLRELEAEGLITVETCGKKTVTVTLVRQPAVPCTMSEPSPK